MREMNRAQLIGRHIVTDLGICHGKPTFRGTRVLVSDVLEQVASGCPERLSSANGIIASPRKLFEKQGRRLEADTPHPRFGGGLGLSNISQPSWRR